jgi:hypothetical protein
MGINTKAIAAAGLDRLVMMTIKIRVKQDTNARTIITCVGSLIGFQRHVVEV